MGGVYAVVASSKVEGADPIWEFQPYSGRVIGGPMPLDCAVSIVNIPVATPNVAASAISLAALPNMPWGTQGAGYLFGIGNATLTAVKNHFRMLRVAKDTRGKDCLWPWFDPNYMRLALDYSDAQNQKILFGPIEWFVFNHQDEMHLYSMRDNALYKRVLG